MALRATPEHENFKSVVLAHQRLTGIFETTPGAKAPAYEGVNEF